MPACAARAGLLACAAIVFLALAPAGCATTSRATKPDAQIVVDLPVADARIYVDDIFAGRAAELRGRAILVRSGTRRVEIRADGYFTAYRDVSIMPGARASVSVPLHAAPPNEQSE